MELLSIYLLYTLVAIAFAGLCFYIGRTLPIQRIRIKDLSARLSRTEQSLRLITEAAPDAMVIADERGEIRQVNKQTEALFGYERQELIGQQVEILMPARFRNDHRDHRAGYYSNPKVRSMGSGLELFAKRKDGSQFPVEISLSPLRSSEGDLVFASIRDITDRKKAEEKFKSLLEAAPDAMIIANEKGSIVLANHQAETVFGFRKAELIGGQVEMLMPAIFRQMHQSHRAQFFSNPKVRAMGTGLELYAMRKNGTQFPVEISLSPLSTDEGILVSASIRDITDRKNLENQLRMFNKELEDQVKAKTESLRESYEAMRQMALRLEDIREEERAAIAREIHDDLGQQLTGLKMDMAWVLKRFDSTDDENTSKRIGDALELLDGCVRSVRRISTELRPSILDDLGLIAAIEWQSYEFQKRSGIRTIFNTDTEEIDLPSKTAVGLFRICQESLTNVARHAEASAVLIKFTRQQEEITLTIEDDGKGFDAEGTGRNKTLGLLGMRERAQMMGGELKIKSEPGRGTTLIISLRQPVAQP